MVAVLLAPLRTDPGGEDMVIGGGAEPGGFVGPRQGDRVQPVGLVAIGDPLADGMAIGSIAPGTAARDPGQRNIDEGQPGENLRFFRMRMSDLP